MKHECGSQSAGQIHLWDSDGRILQKCSHLLPQHLSRSALVDSRESLFSSPDLKSWVCEEELSEFNSVVEEPTEIQTHTDISNRQLKQTPSWTEIRFVDINCGRQWKKSSNKMTLYQRESASTQSSQFLSLMFVSYHKKTSDQITLEGNVILWRSDTHLTVFMLLLWQTIL